MINDITSNSAFREGKFSYYYGMELFKLGETEQALEEFQTMMKNFELVYERFPRARTQYFIKAHVEELTTTLTTLQQYPILIRLSEMDSGSASVLLRNMVKETKN